ncbi:MAG: VWA domain-containing protein [Proteobacteria bacterium]|nr:VWA domain-containing protein [Pseudomonadota bacterium]
MIVLRSKRRSLSGSLRSCMVAVLAAFGCLTGFALAPAALAAVPTDAILVLDNSGSMRKNDPDFLAKRAVSKFVSDLDQETRVGILIFDEKVKYSVPLTELTVNTRTAIQRALDDIDYRGKFTDSPAAIERAIYELKANARDDVVKVIIFMTDGIVDTGNPEVDSEKAKWMREELAADAADSGIKVFGIAFTENADFFLIQSLAKQTDGAYFRALTPEDLAGVFAKVNEILEAPPPVPAPTPSATTGSAALGQCMASLVPDERVAFEQMAAEVGIAAEQLCTEMTLAPEGTAIIIPADQAVSEDDLLGVILVFGLAALVLLGIVVVVVVVIRKRRGVEGAPASQQAEPVAVPDAFIKDIHGISDEPAVQIGTKALMICRVAGNDPANLDYFVINKGTVGRRHAIIQYRDFSFWLIEQGSVNGTFVNGERIEGERQLKHGDRIKFHKYEFEFSMPELEDAGHTVFADPDDLEATMIGEVIEQEQPSDDVIDLTAGAAAPDPEADIFDDEAETALSARHRDAQAAEVEADEIDSEAQTALVDTDPSDAEEGPEFVTVAPSYDADEPSDDAFDAEASAFFGEDSLVPGLVDDEDMGGFEDDDGPAPLTEPGIGGGEAELSETETLLPASLSGDGDEADFRESETLLPASLTGDENETLEATSDISLDEFMRTDSFETPLVDFEETDSEDATLMPEQVTEAPAIDDVFDITAEGTLPAVKPDDAEDDDSPDDDAEGPTVFGS